MAFRMSRAVAGTNALWTTRFEENASSGREERNGARNSAIRDDGPTFARVPPEDSPVWCRTALGEDDAVTETRAQWSEET